MSSIRRRLERVEAARGPGPEGDDLVEVELSPEAKDVVRRIALNIGIETPEEIERGLNERRRVPKSALRPLSPEAEARVQALIAELRRDAPRPVGEAAAE